MGLYDYDRTLFEPECQISNAVLQAYHDDLCHPRQSSPQPL